MGRSIVLYWNLSVGQNIKRRYIYNYFGKIINSDQNLPAYAINSMLYYKSQRW